MEVRRGNKTTITSSLRDQDWHMLRGSEQTAVLDFSSYLDGLPRFSAVDARLYERPIRAAEILE